MKRYMMDSGVASDYMNRRNGIFERGVREYSLGHRIGICTPVLCELQYGVQFSETAEENMQKLRHFVATMTKWPLTDEAAEEFGRIQAESRRRGIVLQPTDAMIAAIAMMLPRCSLVSHDSDMFRIPGLHVERWTS